MKTAKQQHWPNLAQCHTEWVSGEYTGTDQYHGPESDPSVEPKNKEENSGALHTYNSSSNRMCC